MPKPTRRKPAPSDLDPQDVLRQIANDPRAASMARVAACRALLKLAADVPADDDGDGLDELTRKALKMGEGRDG